MFAEKREKLVGDIIKGMNDKGPGMIWFKRVTKVEFVLDFKSL